MCKRHLLVGLAVSVIFLIMVTFRFQTRYPGLIFFKNKGHPGRMAQKQRSVIKMAHPHMRIGERNGTKADANPSASMKVKTKSSKSKVTATFESPKNVTAKRIGNKSTNETSQSTSTTTNLHDKSEKEELEVQQRRDLYKKHLTRIADKEKVIILALVDSGYIDMAVNFYETSLAKFNIKNFLFVSLTESACDELTNFDIPCFSYMDLKQGEDASAYMSPVFLKKMVLRTQFLTDALSWGFRVLQTDTDVIYFKDPFSGFTCPSCDMEVMEDGIHGLMNAGFIHLHPTMPTVNAYKKMMETLKKNPKAEDQSVLNNIVKNVMRGKVKFALLNSKKYPCGKDYFESPRRYFGDTAKSCSECIVVHNNWIVSKAAKIYRFKEMLMWVYDGENYYSNSQRKYLMFDNPLKFEEKNSFRKHEKSALVNALAIGQILNRTVILPKFRNGDILVPLNYHIYIKHFDANFNNRYRESTFLKHPKVPDSVKQGKSNILYIKSTQSSYIQQLPGVQTFTPGDTQRGATKAEILNWFSGMKDIPVLRFHSLYGAFSDLEDPQETKLFAARVKDGFRKAVYRQY